MENLTKWDILTAIRNATVKNFIKLTNKICFCFF